MNIVLLKNILVVLVSFLHFYFLILEMFLWTKPVGLKTFRMTAAQAKGSAVLAANQGLYNGFLAAGLIWSVLTSNTDFTRQLSIFFLSCILVAALYGGYSVGRKILWVQGLPALAAMVITLLT